MYYNHREYIADPERDGDRLFNGAYVNISSEHVSQLVQDFDWIGDFQDAFSEWVEYINMVKTHRQLQIDSNNTMVLSFNYDDMIQKTYKIPDIKVLNIHRFGSPGEYIYVFGHNNEPIGPGIEDGDESDLGLIRRNQYMVYKDCTSRRGMIEEFLAEKPIEEIDVFGCSFNEIDYPYFATVKETINDDSPWTLYYYDEKAKNGAEEYKNRLHIDNCRIVHSSEFPRCLY